MTLLRMAAIVAAITAFACYPYLPGEYDPLAGPLSTVAQGGSAAALLLVPLGLAWLLVGRRTNDGVGRSRGFARAASIALSALGVIVAGVAWGSGGRALGLTVLAFAAALLVARRRAATASPAAPAPTALPASLVIVPLVAVLLQVLLAGPLRAYARERAMVHGGTLVDDLARYHAVHGRYPQSLTAAWPDYKVWVVGIDRFHYVAHDDTYTLYFELPVPLWQAPGTREFVAYAPRGRHLVLSHAAWHLTRPPASLGAQQGWYEARETPRDGWRSFLFD
jgi:hypothetical protein